MDLEGTSSVVTYLRFNIIFYDFSTIKYIKVRDCFIYIIKVYIK